MKKKRTAVIKRKTRETDIQGRLDIDGTGKYNIKTGIGFLDHMLELFSRHGLFDLELKAKGDLRVDIHHTNEDVGICLGEALKKALGDKKGIKRFGWATVPMDEAMVEVTLDISGRPYLKDIVSYPSPALTSELVEHYSFNDAKEFLRAFANNSGVNLIFNIKTGEDLHHILEALFKAFARALDEATQLDPRVKGVPSTKGKL
jgi:imidazoleglycerol-phosphate dehydratase